MCDSVIMILLCYIRGEFATQRNHDSSIFRCVTETPQKKSWFCYVYKHIKKIPSIVKTCMSEERETWKGKKNEERVGGKTSCVRKGSV